MVGLSPVLSKMRCEGPMSENREPYTPMVEALTKGMGDGWCVWQNWFHFMSVAREPSVKSTASWVAI